MGELPGLRSFPDCHECARFASGPPAACLACVRSRIDVPGDAAAACPVCAQRLDASGRCPNELCRQPVRRIGRINGIGYQSGPLRRAINGYKYRGMRTWSVVFGRLLLAWLEENMADDPPGLIVANPSFTGPHDGMQRFAHTEAVITSAAGEARGKRWEFDTATPAAVVKTRPTLRSADAQAWSKRLAGTELAAALRIPDPARTAGKAILVYDDICTTGTQLNAVAAVLLDQGHAARVDAVVLARALWRTSTTAA